MGGKSLFLWFWLGMLGAPLFGAAAGPVLVKEVKVVGELALELNSATCTLSVYGGAGRGQ